MIGIYMSMQLTKSESIHPFGLKAIIILCIIYFAYLSNHLAHYYISKTYGKIRKIRDENVLVQTYQSRAFSLLSTIGLSVFALVTCVQQLGAENLLQTGGVLGIIGIMIGLTQQSWAPDIISGLILLHSDAFVEGDVIELPNHTLVLVHKTKMFHSEMLNLANNHRIMIRNSELRNLTLHNLSKFASARGLRESLCFNIGYEVPPEKVKAMFAEAAQMAGQLDLPFEKQHPTDIKLFEVGDHALTWGFIFYVKSVEQLIVLRREMREVILEASLKHNISLATPLTHQANIKLEKQQPEVQLGIQPSM